MREQFEFPEDESFAVAVPTAPKEAEIERKVPALVDQASAIIIRDQDTLTVANDFSIAIKRMRKEIEETFDPIIEAAHVAHKIALDKKRKYIDPVDAAEKMVKGKIGTYLTEQERIRKEVEEKIWVAEQEKIRAQQEDNRKAQEAERRATEERESIAVEARRQAAEAEARAARARSEEGRRKAQEDADRIRREAVERQKEADALWNQKEDYRRLAESRRQADLAATVPATIVKAETKGISTREDWGFEIINAALVPPEFLVIDEVKLRKYAKAMRDSASVPGVRFFSLTRVQQRIL